MEVRITSVAAGGDGIGRLPDGQVVFCEGALPGELVELQLTQTRKDFARASLVAVREASPVRVEPPCPHVRRGCGGCTWQHVLPSPAVDLKVAVVADALRRIAKLGDVPVRAGGAVTLHGYRTTVRLAVDPDGRPAYRRRHSHDPIRVDLCLVCHPRLADLIMASRFPGAGEVVLRVSAATGERIASPARAPGQAQVPDDTTVSTRDRPAAVSEEVHGRRWRVSASSFFQSGPQAATMLVDTVRAAAGDHGPRVVDLYAGVGLLGGSLVANRPGASLVAVESNRSAAHDARANLADLDARVVAAEVAAARMAGAADLVIADPSRSGLGPSASAAVAHLGAPVVVLVSCDPASLARDARLAAGHGYRLESVEVLDLFPGTFQVESVARFVRG